MSRDPYNSVGKDILAECAACNVTYGFACAEKVRKQKARLLRKKVFESWEAKQ